jgi:hypothetical protein
MPVKKTPVKKAPAKPKLPKYVFWDKYGEGGTIKTDAELKRFIKDETESPYGLLSYGEEEGEIFIAEVTNVQRLTTRTVTTTTLEGV